MEDCGLLWMMEDGAPYHQGVASRRRKQLQEVGWEGWGPGTWPSNSPDLNPIENVWHILKSQIRKRPIQPKNKQQLIDAVLGEWEKIPIEMINNLVDSMERRLRAVIKAKGGATGY